MMAGLCIVVAWKMAVQSGATVVRSFLATVSLDIELWLGVTTALVMRDPTVTTSKHNKKGSSNEQLGRVWFHRRGGQARRPGRG
jgi:hypothetical protein